MCHLLTYQKKTVSQKKKKILSLYCIADCPQLNKPLLAFAFVQLFASVAVKQDMEAEE